VTVAANNLTVTGTNAGLFSTTSGAGNAGTVTASIGGAMTVANGGAVSSNTSGAGEAGSIVVSAGSLSVDGSTSRISASAAAGSSGQTGSVNVSAANSITLSNGAQIAITNDATVSDPAKYAALHATTLTVSAPDITLNNDAQITAQATGNVAASDIKVNFTDKLWLDPTAISASAFDGAGGSISIFGGAHSLFVLDRSIVFTSVTGAGLLAGDINITAQTLVMLNGFIQANAAAAGATGGAVTLNVGNILPGGGVLLVGGSTPLPFRIVSPAYNVIQAASPGGLSGKITGSAPTLDVAGSLLGLDANLLQSGGFSRSPCASSGSSSFAQAGRGGLPPSSFGALRAESDSSAVAAPMAAAFGPTVVASRQAGCSA
jgi:hypothetical protein